MEQKKEIRRGEMWYISAPNNNPASTALGRPAIVLSNDKACAAAPEIAAVYATTNVSKCAFRENVPIFSAERESTARCNGVPLIPRAWFQYKMCEISDDEMKAIEKGLFYALDISASEELRGLKQKVSFYKALYQETLSELARKTLAEDLRAARAELAADVELPDEQDLPSEPETWKLTPEEEELARELAELEAAEGEEESESEPAEESEAPEKPKKKMVNVNTATWWELHRKFEIDQDTAKEIIAARIEAKGAFQSVEEVLSLRCLSKKDIKKMEGRIAL